MRTKYFCTIKYVDQKNSLDKSKVNFMHSQSTADSRSCIVEDDYIVELPTPSERLENLRQQVQKDSDQRDDKKDDKPRT